MQGKLIVDFGGGPCSLLLKCQNVRGIVVDPCDYPRWITDRYLAAGIRHVKVGAEDAQWEDDPSQNPADEIWIYNVLQHVVDPAAVISNAQRQSRLIRLFEWIECGTSEGHPHELTEAVLNRWLQGQGKVEEMNENTAVGRAYFGVFKGNHYGV